jgi:hypothetical protein
VAVPPITLFRGEQAPPTCREVPAPPPARLFTLPPPPVRLFTVAPPSIRLFRQEQQRPLHTELPPQPTVAISRELHTPPRTGGTVAIPSVSIVREALPCGPCSFGAATVRER